MKWAFGLLCITVMRYYGYYVISAPAPRTALAFSGVHALALSIAVLYLIFHRMTDWRASVLVMMAMGITVIESSLIAVCGSWYAFIYKGPPLFGDTCELMTGSTLAKPLAYTLATLSLIILPRVWNRKWATRNSGI